jgi:hypothetical protein
MATMSVTSKVPENIQQAGFDHAVVVKHCDDEAQYIACFKNRFDAIMFMHANKIKEEHGVETASFSRK